MLSFLCLFIVLYKEKDTCVCMWAQEYEKGPYIGRNDWVICMQKITSEMAEREKAVPELTPVVFWSCFSVLKKESTELQVLNCTLGIMPYVSKD